jgi:hypothetical protein
MLPLEIKKYLFDMLERRANVVENLYAGDADMISVE